jgi:hypothetical protein
VANWTFLTNHARVLLCIAHDPGVRLRDIAASLDITERSAYSIVTDLVPLEYSIGLLTCAVAGRLHAVVLGWPGAAQDRLRADMPGTRPGRPGVPWRPGGGCCAAGAPA